MKINIKYLISVMIVIAPWLSNYKFIVSGVSIGDILIIAAIGISFLFQIKSRSRINSYANKSFRILLFYLLYGIVVSIFVILIGNELSDDLIIKRILKMTLYFCAIFLVIKNSIDFMYFKKIYKKMVYISILAILAQYIGFYVLNIYFEFKLPFLSYSAEAAEQFNYALSRLSSFRPDSIFLEPSHFVYFVFPYVVLTLFDEKTPNILEASLISLAILMSKSSAGLFFLIFIWGCFIAIKILRKNIGIRKKAKYLSLATMSFLIISIIFMNTNLYDSYRRVDLLSNNAAERVWSKVSFGDIYVHSLDGMQLLFGNGLGNYPVPVFVNTINFIVYCSGLLGFFIIAYWLFKTFINANDIGKVMIGCVLMLFSAWYLIYSPIFILYNAIIIHNPKVQLYKNKTRYID